VLVVDADVDVRAYIRYCLAELPVTVAEAVDGRDALRWAEAQLDDALALVIANADQGGRSLRQLLGSGWPLIPVLLITGARQLAIGEPTLRDPYDAQRLRHAVLPLIRRTHSRFHTATPGASHRPTEQ
jgi:DNA-binding response OmpR family regulator